MLRMTNIKLKLITDIDQHLMVEKCIRGGISYIGHRYAKANNKYLSDYDPSKPSSYIIYLDANNLYGWAMSQPLTTGNFRWVQRIQKDLDTYLVECDLEFPEDTTIYKEYPLAPERTVVQDEWLSSYQKDLKEKLNIKSDKIPKLLCTLRKKEKYVAHGRLLDLYLKLGMNVTKIHRVLKFDSSPWLKEYIAFNTTKRAQAKNEFEKNHFKLMNNSVYGKTMENLCKRENIKLYNSYDKFVKEASRPTFVNRKKFNENLYAVHSIKEELHLIKPCYVGACIVELSKYLMYDFHYNVIQKKYGSRAKLLFTDTNSLCYLIEIEDIYDELYNSGLKDFFDNADYKEDSPYHFKYNKKVIGKMKDETAGWSTNL